MTRRRRTAMLIVAASLAAAGCGGGSDDASGGGPSADAGPAASKACTDNLVLPNIKIASSLDTDGAEGLLAEIDATTQALADVDGSEDLAQALEAFGATVEEQAAELDPFEGIPTAKAEKAILAAKAEAAEAARAIGADDCAAMLS